MKKLLLLLIVASVGIAGTATAQKKHKKDWDYNKDNSNRKHDRHDDRYDRDGRYDDRNSKHAPRKVRDAFNRDYPNASNVTWVKGRGIWTANFKRNKVFGGSNNSVSYRANGERVGTNSNGVFGKTSGNNTQRRPGIFGRTGN